MLLDSFHQKKRKILSRKDLCSLPANQRVHIEFNIGGLPGASSSSCVKKGSLTVEAACVLPLFLYSMIAALYFLVAIQAELSVATELGETACELAVRAYSIEEGSGLEAVKEGLSVAYIKGRIAEKLRKDKDGLSVIKGGAGGVSLLGSSFLENEMIQLKASYRVRIPIPIPGLGEFSVLQKGSVRAWTGRTGTMEDSQEGEEGTQVYITAAGRVYHLDETCTHIRLSVKSVGKERLSGLRNRDGGRYYPCESCADTTGYVVFITETGDRYHSTLSCRGLKRAVTKVPLSQLEGWRACSRCGG